MKIHVNHISKQLDDRYVLKNIRLHFESHKVYGLQGRNGSGKTMLMRAVLGLLLPDEGVVEMNGKKLGKEIDFPPSCGALIENPNLIMNRTGFENLEIFASIKNIITKERICELMEYFELDPTDGKSVRKYSLGMKQKIGIIAAFMEQPDLIVLDEPYNGIDEKAMGKLNELIRREKERGALILLSSHDKEELVKVCDEYIQMKDGEVITDDKKS